VAQRWTFSDTVTDTSYTFIISPNADTPVYQKNMQFEAMTVPGGSPLLFEGQDTPTTFSVSGDILTKGQYEMLLFFYNLRHQFLCTDDLGKQRWVYLTEFQPVRKLSRSWPFRYTYTLSGYQFGTEIIPDSIQSPNYPYSN
jgi:hypothetical protein